MLQGIKKIECWASFLKEIRNTLEQQGYLEVMTNHLVEAGAIEGTIDTLKVYGGEHYLGELHSSPEIEMKKLIAEHKTSIFQICRSFRDDPTTGIHLKEFTMLEFYKVGKRAEDVLQNTLELFQRLAKKQIPTVRHTVTELYGRLGLDLEALTTAEAFQEAILRKNLLTLSSQQYSWDDLFFTVLVEKIEPFFSEEVLTIVEEYPVRVSALAQQKDQKHSSFVAERFEIYWKKMEICNGASEVIQWEELQKRLATENEIRVVTGKKPHPTPNTLLEASKQGVPPCAGVAIGLDRLFACMEFYF